MYNKSELIKEIIKELKKSKNLPSQKCENIASKIATLVFEPC